MKHRNPIAVALLPFVTFGIYGMVWAVKTKGEMNRLGAQIPTAWLLIVPFVNIWWLWKYSEGVEHVTGGKTSTAVAFLLQFLLGAIGDAIVQDGFNKLADASVASSGGTFQPVAPATPDPAPVTPTTPTSAPADPASAVPATPQSDPPNPPIIGG